MTSRLNFDRSGKIRWHSSESQYQPAAPLILDLWFCRVYVPDYEWWVSRFCHADSVPELWVSRFWAVRTVDPEALAKTMSLATRPEAPKSPLIPDDQGRKDPNWVARRQAARNGLGISFRQEGIGSSLHVAYDETDCDVHVDRNGFVVRRANGKVHWDLNGLLRHLTVDLIPDRAPWAAASIGYRDKQQRPLMKATISPWVAVDLPSRENEGQVELKIGVLFKGTFDAL